MILSTSRRFIFVHNYKTGGESIAAALTPHLDRTDLALNREFQLLGATAPKLTDITDFGLRRRIRREHPELRALSKHSSAAEIRNHVSAETWNDCYKFAFIRHPVDRTISLYQYCARMMEVRKAKKFPVSAWYVTPWGKRTDPLYWPAMIAFAATSSFSEFIRHPALVEEGAMQPQVDSICGRDGEVIVDCVARFEQFDEEFARIQAAIGVPAHAAAKRNSSGTPSVTRAKLSNDDRVHLAQQFADDFARLDYDL
jgi:Sulfotransferase family